MDKRFARILGTLAVGAMVGLAAMAPAHAAGTQAAQVELAGYYGPPPGYYHHHHYYYHHRYYSRRWYHHNHHGRVVVGIPGVGGVVVR